MATGCGERRQDEGRSHPPASTHRTPGEVDPGDTLGETGRGFGRRRGRLRGIEPLPASCEPLALPPLGKGDGLHRGEPVRAAIRVGVRTMAASSSRGVATEAPVPLGNTAPMGYACGGGANRSSRSRGESGPISVCRVNCR
jgi:hypothetical protein